MRNGLPSTALFNPLQLSSTVYKLLQTPTTLCYNPHTVVVEIPSDLRATFRAEIGESRHFGSTIGSHFFYKKR